MDDEATGLRALFGDADETDDVIEEQIMWEYDISTENFDQLAIIAGVFDRCGIEYSVSDWINVAIEDFLEKTRKNGSRKRI